MNRKLSTLAEEFVSATRSIEADDQQVNTILQQFFNTVGHCKEPEIREALGVLSGAFGASSLELAILAAHACGVLVEQGTSPAEMQEALFAEMRLALSISRRIAEKLIARIDPSKEVTEEFDDLLNGECEANPEAARAWSVVEGLYLPCVAVLSYSPDCRKAVSDLLDDALQLSQLNQGAHWMARILQVLDNEPYLAIEPATKIGVIGKISGISGNFQLNELLMAVFPQKGLFRQRRISKAVEETARGLGPQQSGETVAGHWNLCTWKALDKEGLVPKGLETENWIWNEGIPADIPAFDGYRVILLGESPYARSWNSCRDFTALKADLTVERQLSAKEVDDWLKKFTIQQGV